MPTTLLLVAAPEAGHILPFLHIAHSLTKARFRVVFLTGANWAEYLAAEGFEVHTLSGTEAAPVETRELFQPRRSGKFAWRQEWASLGSGLPVSTLFLRRLFAVAELVQPRLTVIDRLFRRKLAHVITRFRAHWPISYVSTSFLYEEQSLPLYDAGCVVLCPPELLPEADGTRFAGVEYGEPAISLTGRQELPDELARLGSRPLILCGFGSQQCRYGAVAARLELLVRVAQRLPDIDFVIAGEPPSPLLASPDNLIWRAALPQLRLLERVSLFVTHGGLGGIKEAIYHGIPMLCWPVAFDQFLNARCVTHSGLGDTLGSENPDIDEVVRLIEKLLRRPPELTDSLKRFQNLFRERQQIPLTARIFERQIGDSA